MSRFFNKLFGPGIGLVVLGGIMMGCSGDSNNDPISASLSMKVTTGSLAKAAADTVILSEVKILLSEIELEGLETMDSDGDGDEDGEEVELGPFVVPLNLNGNLTTIAGAMIPNGTYDEIEFEIRKPEDDENVGDADFVDATDRYSIVVRGTYHDTAFVWKTSLDIEQELELNPPMVVNDSLGASNVSILVNPFSWFIDNGAAMDPRDEGNRSQIENNIQNGFKAFKDDDKDGDDHDDDDDHGDD
jgi:hypothetical protein